MNIFHRVTLASLRENRTRTTVTVIGIILSTAMICAVTTLASSFLHYAMESEIYATGNWYGRALGTDYETYESIEDSEEAEGAVYLQQLGYARAEGCQNEYKPYIYLLGAGPGADEVLPIHMTDGRYPTSPEEILLPNHLYENGGVSYSLGDHLTLSLGQRVLDGDVLTQESPCYVNDAGNLAWNGEELSVRETRTYTVVGFYERLHWTLEWNTAPGYTAFTCADGTSGAYAYDVYFRTKDPGDIYGFMGAHHLAQDTNSGLLMYTGTFRNPTFHATLYSLAAIIIVLIMFGSVALIYNAFSISVSERTRQFALLSSVGATKKQLRRMVLFEALVVSAIGVPIGILSGIGGIGVTLLFIGDKFSEGGPVEMTLSVSPLSVLIAAAVALITVLISAWIPSRRAVKVSPIEAIRQTNDVQVEEKPAKTSRLTYALFGLPGVLASKYYRRDKRKYRTTILSLFMSIVLFVSASSFTSYLMEAATAGFETVRYDLQYMAERTALEEAVEPDALLEQIRRADAVTGAAFALEIPAGGVEVQTSCMTPEAISFVPDTWVQGDGTVMLGNMHVNFVDDASFQALLAAQGLDEAAFMDDAHPLAVAVDGMTAFNVHTERYAPIRYFSESSFDASLWTDPTGSAPDASLHIGAVITEKPDFLRNIDGPNLLYPISLGTSVIESFDEQTASQSYYFTIVSDAHAQSDAAVQTLLRENRCPDPDSLYDLTGSVESDRNTITIIRVFSYGFIVLISLIAAANVFNTITTNISLRRREFAILKSVGMSGKGFNRMMGFECLLYGSRALLLGLPVSCLVTWLIYNAIRLSYATDFRLPWATMGIAALSVFLVVFVTIMYAMRKVKKDNPIDVLKNENL